MIKKEKTMKKIITLLTLFALILTFAACNTTTGEPKTSTGENSKTDTDTQDEVNREASDVVLLNDGSSTTDQTSGETNEDIDGDDYLYEDNNIPTIPGISPDWKPNANGKYPLKDGYTEYEMTLIVACEIELDFGDMTDEEISKLEFRLIEEDTEE
jgi:hypothetical protein